MDDKMYELIDRLIKVETEKNRLEYMLLRLHNLVDSAEYEGTKRRISLDYFTEKIVCGEIDTGDIRSIFGWKTKPETQALIDGYNEGKKGDEVEYTLRTD